MHDFLTALEFLTRFRVTNADDWSEQDFSRSVPYFPLIGLLIGAFLALFNYCFMLFAVPDFLRSALLIWSEIFLTGGLMYDGFMDTADGVFSARERERMLQIMKDSHVGANAVLAVGVLFLLKMGTYLAIDGHLLTTVLIAMSVATRTFMVLYIIRFSYARKEGIGLLFKKYAKAYYIYIAFFIGLVLLYNCGVGYLTVTFGTFAVCLVIAHYLSCLLGGLTGDTYGALTECGNVIFLMIAYFLLR